MTVIVRPENRFSKLCNRKYQYSLFSSILVVSIIALFFTEIQNPILPFFIDQNTPSITYDYVCPFEGDKWIVITTIFYPTPAIHKFS